MLARLKPAHGVKVLAALLAVMTAVIFGPPTAASAADGPHYWMYTDDSAPNGGKVDFWSLGDIVQVCDIDADSARAVVTVQDLTSGYALYTVEASGNGVCSSRRASDGGVYDLTEGHCIGVNIYLLDNGKEVPGSWDSAGWRNYNDAKVNC